MIQFSPLRIHYGKSFRKVTLCPSRKLDFHSFFEILVCVQPIRFDLILKKILILPGCTNFVFLSTNHTVSRDWSRDFIVRMVPLLLSSRKNVPPLMKLPGFSIFFVFYSSSVSSSSFCILENDCQIDVD